MTNLSKKRTVIYIKKRKPENRNSFFKDTKNMILTEYEKRLKSHLEIMDMIHKLIETNKGLNMDKDEYSNQQNKYLMLAHQKMVISSLIDCISIFDFYINIVMENFQKYKQNKTDKSIISYWKIEKGIEKSLKGLNQSDDFKKQFSIIKYFRKLRHKFAHSVHLHDDLVLFIKSDEKDFESFLGKLDGIFLNQNSFWTKSAQGNIHAMVLYHINSDKFIYHFFEESLIFFKMFVELLFPEETKNNSDNEF